MLESFRKFEGREVIATLGTVKGRGRPKGRQWLTGEITTYLCGPSKKDDNKRVFLALESRTGIPIGGVTFEIVLSKEEATEFATILTQACHASSE